MFKAPERPGWKRFKISLDLKMNEDGTIAADQKESAVTVEDDYMKMVKKY